MKAKLLPTEWLGEQSADLVSEAVNSLLDDINEDRAHQIRQAFDRATIKLIANLKTDPEIAERADNIKEYLKNDEAFNRYVGEMWADLRGWMKADMQSTDSRMKKRISDAGLWLPRPPCWRTPPLPPLVE
jgi:Predicted membrane protein